MAVDPWHKYSNEAERAKRYIYDDFKLKTPVYLYGWYKMVSALQGLNTATKPCLLRQVLVKMLKLPWSCGQCFYTYFMHLKIKVILSASLCQYVINGRLLTGRIWHLIELQIRSFNTQASCLIEMLSEICIWNLYSATCFKNVHNPTL